MTETKSETTNKNSNTDKTAPIGVFDSGVGGLTVVREIMRQLPNEKIIYFGDTARVPYGNKSRETVVRFSEQIMRFLKTFRVKTIVVACNTASAYAMDALERDCDVPIIGVVKPGARLNRNVTIYGKSCPLFVPLVEEGLLEDPVTDEIARRYLTELIDIDIDTLILGCTHYPLIRSTLGKIAGPDVTLVNPAYETARELRRMLTGMDLLGEDAPKLGSNQYQFYVSDMAEKFVTFANSIIKYGILSAKTIRIEQY